MEGSGSGSSGVQAGSHLQLAKGLADLPVDAVACIVRQLEPDDRCKLLRSSRALWLLSKAWPEAFYESVDLRLSTAAGARRAAGWLASRQAAVRHLVLREGSHSHTDEDVEVHVQAAALLDQLAGCQLRTLEWHNAAGQPSSEQPARAQGQRSRDKDRGQLHRPVLGNLRLPYLRRLALMWTRDPDDSPHVRLASALSSLPALQELCVSGYLSVSLEPGCPPASLTSLQLPDCELCSYPDLAAVPRLRRLQLRLCAPRRARWSRAAEQRREWGPQGEDALQHLTALTSLDIVFVGCQLKAVPWSLGALSSLQELQIAGPVRDPLRLAGSLLHLLNDGGLSVLAALAPSLTRLALRQVLSLEGLPPELGALSALRELDLSGCLYLSEEPEDWEWVEGLTQLRVLSLRGCDLNCIPGCVWQLPCLEELDVSGNPMLASTEEAYSNGLAMISTIPAPPPGQPLVRLGIDWEPAAQNLAYLQALTGLQRLEVDGVKQAAVMCEDASFGLVGSRPARTKRSELGGRWNPIPPHHLELLGVAARHPSLRSLVCVQEGRDGEDWGELLEMFEEVPELEDSKWRLCSGVGAPYWFFEGGCEEEEEEEWGHF